MTNTLEDRIATALKAVAATVPDHPPTTWVGAEPRALRQGRRRWWPSMARLTPWGRLASVAGLAIVATGAGVGVAAAAGAFSTDLGSAGGLITSSHSAPGEVTRLVVAGPDGSTLKVVSASSNSHSGCMELVITDPAAASSRTVHEPGACQSVGNPTVAPTQTHASPGELKARTTWKSPTGTVYAIVYGQAASGATSVADVTGFGTTVATAVSIRNGWFAIAVPASTFRSSSLVFYGLTGRVVTTQESGSGGL